MFALDLMRGNLLVFGSYRLELVARARAFAWDRSLRKVRFASFVWKVLLGSLRLENIVCDF